MEVDILEKKKEWVTYKDIEKDLKPYLDGLLKKCDSFDSASLNNQIDILEELFPIITARYHEAMRRNSDARDACINVHKQLFELPGHKIDKLKHLLNAQTGLSDNLKEMILQAWEKNYNKTQRSGWISVVLNDENLTVMEDFLKRKSEEMSELHDKLEKLICCTKVMVDLYCHTSETLNLLKNSEAWRFSIRSSSAPFPVDRPHRRPRVNKMLEKKPMAEKESKMPEKKPMAEKEKKMAEKKPMAEKESKMPEKKPMAEKESKMPENKPISSSIFIGQHLVHLQPTVMKVSSTS